MAFDPTALVSLLGQRYRGCYSRLDGLRLDSKYPTAAQAERLLAEWYAAESHSAAAVAPVLCGAAVWNIFKRFYAYNDILSGFLVAAAEGLEASAELPLEGLRYLPVPCIYVQAPNAISDDCDGFFAWEEEPKGTDSLQDPLLWLAFVMGDGAFTPYSYVRLTSGAVLRDCLPDALAVTEPVIWAAAHGNDLAWNLLSGVPAVPGKLGNVIHNLTVRAVQLLLYLVSMDADVADTPAIQGHTVTAVSVGAKAGERLRHIATQKRSHIRQGHWHKYWVGPKNGERRLVAKWIEPVIVGDGKIKTSKVTLGGKVKDGLEQADTE